jgi:hypothetical protein
MRNSTFRAAVRRPCEAEEAAGHGQRTDACRSPFYCAMMQARPLHPARRQPVWSTRHLVPCADSPQRCQNRRAWHRESQRFRLPGLPPATTEAPTAEETPVPEEASMTEATPRISGCTRCGHTHSRYPGHSQDLSSHGSQAYVRIRTMVMTARPLTKKDLTASPAIVAMASPFRD